MATAELQVGGRGLQSAFAQYKADYRAAGSNRFTRRLSGVHSSGSGADYHLRSERHFFHMIELSREIDRNDLVVGQGITRLVDNVLQEGLRLDTATGSEALNAALEAKWKAWSSDAEAVDITGEHTLRGLAGMVLRHVIVDGDIDVLTLQDGRLQAIEAHRIRTPARAKSNVVHGIELNSHRRPLRHHFTVDDVKLTASIRKSHRFANKAVRDGQGHKQVLHVYNPRRVSQTRGVTALAPITGTVGQLDDINFAKLVQQQIVSCYAIITERPEQFGGNGLPTQVGSQTAETRADGTTRTLEGVAPGMSVTGAPGEKLTGFSPNVPNAEYFDHVHLILTFIAINLGIPVQVLLLDANRTNFSGWRGAMDQARMGMKAIQGWMRDRFYLPVYEFKVREWLLTDPEIASLADDEGVNPFGHNWQCPAWAYIEPSKDAAADTKVVENRLNSRRSVLNKRNVDIEDVDREIVEDNVRLITSALDAARTLNADFPEAQLDWRELVNFDPKGRRPNPKAGVMDDIGKAVRAGVPVAVSEARSLGLGLDPDPPSDDTLLRFNDQDILQYHIEDGIVTRNEGRKRLSLPAVDGGDEFVFRNGLTRSPVSGESDQDESDADGADADEKD